MNGSLSSWNSMKNYSGQFLLAEFVLFRVSTTNWRITLNQTDNFNQQLDLSTGRHHFYNKKISENAPCPPIKVIIFWSLVTNFSKAVLRYLIDGHSDVIILRPQREYASVRYIHFAKMLWGTSTWKAHWQSNLAYCKEGLLYTYTCTESEAVGHRYT